VGIAHGDHDRIQGDSGLAALLDAVRNLIDAESVSLHMATASGSLGELLAGVGPEIASGNWPEATSLDRLSIGSADAGSMWLPGRRGRCAVHASLLQAGAGDHIIFLCRPKRGDLVYRRELEHHITLYMPLIEPAIAQWSRARTENLRTCEQQAVFDALGHGLLVVDAECHIRMENLAARAMLATSDVLSGSGGRLTIKHIEDAMRFQVSVRHVLDTAHRKGSIIVTIRRGNALPLLLAIQALSRGALNKGLAVVQIIDPAAEMILPLESLSRHYDLTQAEHRLIEQLVRGRTLGEAAIAMRLKEQTARTYLKQIFQKTGMHRQVELVRIVLAGAIPNICVPG
jgi:DNA-binding CsgD family transcriptional regulator